MSEQDILRLKVAVNDVVLLHQQQRLQHLTSKSLDESSSKPCKAVRFDKLIQIDAEQLSSYAEMATEVEMLGFHDNIVLVLWVLFRLC